ncbi:MAG: leucine-rich repeat domain-containing protein [Verrucomicrobiota bacterium]|jgi:hypothetical protein
MKKTFIAISGFLLLAAPATVHAQYGYSTNSDNTLTITNYTGPGGIVAIPNTINGLSVTGIGDKAFYNTSNLANVTIPDSVTSIGDGAFLDCANMTNITVPNSVTSIGDGAFLDCSNLVNFAIPGSVTVIGDYAFEFCNNLQNVVIPKSVTSIGYDAFFECGLTNLSIGTNDAPSNSGCVIQQGAFYDCFNLTNLTIGNNVASLGYWAFEGCDKLANATIGSGVIQEYAFDGLTDLATLTLGPGVTSIGFQAFYECSNLRNVAVGTNVTSIGYAAFQGCGKLTNATIGSGAIGEFAFYNCYDLASVTFGKGVTSIGATAFDYCTNLVGLYFQGNAPYADSEAFYDDTNSNLIVYYYSGATGWSSTFDNIPTVELLPNSLQITLGPTAARAAGAEWQLDGGFSQNGSMTTLDDLLAGSRTVSFTPIPGWITPANQTLTITNGEAAAVFGIYTPTNTPVSGLVLLTNGYGTIHHSAWPKTLVIGEKYMLMAVPDLSNAFAFWAGGTNQHYSLLNESAGYAFIMESNLVLEASFITNLFAAAAGVYNGLFSGSNGVTEESAGMLKGLTVGTKGTYSGTLLINGGSHAIKGSFDFSGRATNLISRTGSQGPLLLEMALLTSGDSAPRVTGKVSGTNNGVPWVATNLLADLAANTLPSAEYTMLIPPDPNNKPPLSSPGGDGYALITNYAGTVKNPASATARISGALADGSAFSQAVPVSQDGYIPVYASLYAGKGLLMGWINLDSIDASGVGLTWIHPPTKTGLYTNGFTNTLLANQIQLSLWTNPPGGLDLLAGLLTLAAINDTNGVANIAVTTSASGVVTATSPTVSGAISLKTGMLKVAIGSGASKVSGFGAVLLNPTNGIATGGGGYFLTPNDSQALELEP